MILNPISGKSGGGVQVEVLEYTGTGSYGSSNPNKLTFSFEPKIVFICDTTSTSTIAKTYVWGCASFLSSILQSSANLYYCRVTVNGSMMSWYSTSTAVYQCNGNDVVYRVVAIG